MICFKLFVPTSVCKVAVEPLGSVQSVWMVFRISVNESRYGKEAHDGQFVS